MLTGITGTKALPGRIQEETGTIKMESLREAPLMLQLPLKAAPYLTTNITN